jgi:hypothetical protein
MDFVNLIDNLIAVCLCMPPQQLWQSLRNYPNDIMVMILYQAMELPAMDMGGVSDPYVKVNFYQSFKQVKFYTIFIFYFN